MCKLTYSTEIIEKRNFGRDTVKQSLLIEVDYDHEDDSFEVLNAKLYENGKYVAEISKLLDKCEGSPLNAILDEISWKEVYQDWKLKCLSSPILTANNYSRFQTPSL